MTNQSDALFLGIDAGGTNTSALLMRADGTVVGAGTAGPANHVSMGVEVARAAIAESVAKAFSGTGCNLTADTPDASVAPNALDAPVAPDAPTAASARIRSHMPVGAFPPIAAIALGSSGLEQPGDSYIARLLLPVALHQVPTVFDTDAIMALEGALGGRPGIVMAAGTGSIAIGRDQKGKRAYAGGWGWRAGDEGSGYWIGQRVLEAVFQAADGRRSPTLLTQAVLDTLRLAGCMELRDWVCAPQRVPADIAALAVTADTAAAQGDASANEILAAAAEQLALTVQAVAAALDMYGGYVSFTGGVFRSNRLRTLFTRLLTGDTSAYQVLSPALPPVAGAALHAWRLGKAMRMGLTTDAVWQVEVEQSVVAQLQQYFAWVR